MIIVGERLNSTRRVVHEAMARRDEAFLLEQAAAQRAAGAAYIDLNTAALLGSEIETLRWAVPLLSGGGAASPRTGDPAAATGELSLDTPNPEAMGEGLRLHRGRALLNSLSGEAKRMQALLPLIREYKPRVIALCLDDAGLPETSDREAAIAENLASALTKQGLAEEDIFIDPLVRPIGVDQGAANLFLEALEKIKRRLPAVKTIAGISNISFGMPGRRALNRAFLILAIERGLDAAILDPLDKELLAGLHSASALLGRDPLKSYLSFMRQAKARDAGGAS